MSPTRILFLSQGRAAENTAIGHVRVRHALAAGLEPSTPSVELEYADVRPFRRRERLWLQRLPVLPEDGWWTLRWHLARGLKARRGLASRLEDGPLDVAHVTTDQVALALGNVRTRLPCVLSLDVTTADWVAMVSRREGRGGSPLASWALRKLEQRALERAPLVIAWTDTVRGEVEKLAPSATVETLHPGIDLEAFSPAPPASGGRRRVLFVGGRWVDKGGPELIEALRPELGRTVELDVVSPGEIPSLPGVHQHRLNPGDGRIAELFRQADVLCLPSFADAVPWVVIEALASGVPIVASDVGSIPELVGDAGIVGAPGDARLLRENLLAVLGDDQRRRAMSEAGRDQAERRYDARVNTPRLLEHLRAVAARTVD